MVGILLTSTALATEGWRNGWINWLTLLLVVNIVFLLLALLRTQGLVSVVRESLGGKRNSVTETTIANFFNEVKHREAEVDTAIGAVKEIGQDAFPGLISHLKNDHIKNSLLVTHEKISALRKNERENNWITQGIASVTGVKHQGNDIADYALQIISGTVKYLHANQGGFFIVKQDEGDTYFELLASYAYDKKKKKISLGEGLIGQVYYEKRVILVTKVPDDYVKITSGLGGSLPCCICIVPLVSDGKVYGAVEIASFQKLQPFEIEYLEKVGENVGYNLKSIDGHLRTEQLLADSQQMAQEVKSQEEELRQNMEELAATQEQMQRKQAEMDAVLASLSALELDAAGIILSANPVFLGITGYENSDLNNKPYLNLISRQGNDRLQYEMMWKSLMSGKTFSGEFRILNSDGKELWMVGNFTPLLGQNGKPYKVMVISLFTTQDKEKLLELQEMMSALKNCFAIAEINPDLTFKSANELFLSELGIKRVELKKLKLKDTFHNGSFHEVENYFKSNSNYANNLDISLQCKNGEVRPFSVTLTKISSNDQLKKGIMILRKPEH